MESWLSSAVLCCPSNHAQRRIYPTIDATSMNLPRRAEHWRPRQRLRRCDRLKEVAWWWTHVRLPHDMENSWRALLVVLAMLPHVLLLGLLLSAITTHRFHTLIANVGRF